MASFRCKMITPAGRTIETTMIGESKTSLRHRLEKDGNFVLDISRLKGKGSIIQKGKGHTRLKSNELYSFNLEFSVLLRSGLSIVAALDTIIEKDDKSDLNELLKVIRLDIANGESLSGAFGNYAHIFSNLYTATLQAGEKSGNVPLALTRYLEYLKRVSAIRQKVISASIYPVILLSASFVVLAFLLIFVVPSITGAFSDAGTELPGITQFLLDVSRFFKSHFSIFSVFAIAVAIGLSVYRKTPAGQMRIDRYMLDLPFVGALRTHYAISKMTRTLSTILSGGVPLVDALRISGGILANRYLQTKVDEIVGNVIEGASFSDSLKQSGIYPGLAIRMISAGENSGALEQVLNDVADFYENDVEAKLSMLTSAIEPALMIIMGLTIGFIVMAMYMPIFQMAGTIG